MAYLPLANILHHKLRSLLNALGIGIGICMLLTLSGLSRGSLGEIADRWDAVNAQLLVYPAGWGESTPTLSGVGLSDRFAQRIEQQNPGKVARAVPVFLWPMKVGGQDHLAAGVDPGQWDMLAGGKKLSGGRLFDPDMSFAHWLEKQLLDASRKLGYGAQFGGKYYALDIRVIRLPRHGASCPVGMGVSCSADRNMKGKITKDGIWLEKLEANPGRFIPDSMRGANDAGVVKVNLNQPMSAILADLSKYPVKTRLSLNGTIIVARDIAHAKLKERLDRGEGLPQYIKDHPVYYAGPAKTPKGLPSGSFGPSRSSPSPNWRALRSPCPGRPGCP